MSDYSNDRIDFAAANAAACEAVLRLRGEVLADELGRIARALLGSSHGAYVATPEILGERVAPAEGVLRQVVENAGNTFGYYELPAGDQYTQADRRDLAGLATLTGTLLQVQSMAQRATRAYAQVEGQLAHQSQILDQIHESVLTTDLLGYITSWNKGAERMFGYTALEAIGTHVLFLYADEDGTFPDAFAEYGGRMMEVRRKRKSGEVFWASLSLSPLTDLEDKPVGLIAYLTDITERKLAEERLNHLAYYDELTGLPNRTLFARLVDQALMVAQRNVATGCVLFLDLNRFKLVNGTLGRQVGDELLRQVARRFRDTLREEDVVAHLSGDEFAVGLFDIRQHFEATTVAQKLQVALEDPFLIEGHELRVGASVGISVFPTDGDELLRQVARRFRDTLREEDVVAHLSGDEFAVGLFDIRQHFEATTVAQKLQVALEDPFLIEGHELRVGASVGISVFPTDGDDAETLLRLADIAMERAKQDCDNPDRSVAFYSTEMNRGMQERMRIESGLRHALGHGELMLYYQPKFEIGTGQIVGAEALVRWVHPERGVISPAEFIPLAESTGLIVQLGEWVLEQACAQAAIWQGAGLPPLRLAVNVSAREFTPSLPARVADTLKRYKLDPSWLELEITESTLMHDIERVIGIMDRINKLGVALSLDDFGTGYSSLSYLKRFPIHTLKIDRSFTTGIPADASDCAIAGTIISIGRQLRHRVIAEGVETLEQLEFLRKSGCDEVQGYLYAKPLPAYEFELGLRENWLLSA